MPDEQAWDQWVREICQALARRDAIDCRSDGKPESLADCRQRRFWQAQARSRLDDLAGLVATMPQPAMARETLAELRAWADSGAIRDREEA